jgi:group I intron endonuclease
VQIVGIYQIQNKLTKQCYIGSSVRIKKRFYNHKSDLKTGRHHSIKLQRAWNKYGPEAFEWSILQECSEEQLPWLEALWMAKLDSFKNGYNIEELTLDAGIIVRRRHHTEEAKAKMRGRKLSEEAKAKIREARSKQVFTEETNAKRRGKKRSEETLANMRGRKVSEETKEKHKRPQTTEAKLKISLANKGQTRSQETKLKMQEAWKRRKLNNSQVVIDSESNIRL